MNDLLDGLGDSNIVRIPEITLDYDNNVFTFSGESYPENGRRYFEDVFGGFFEHFEGCTDKQIKFTFALTYFNSGSAHFLSKLVDFLEALAVAGNDVEIIWKYYEDDDSMLESGEDFREEAEHVNFVLEELKDDAD